MSNSIKEKQSESVDLQEIKKTRKVLILIYGVILLVGIAYYAYIRLTGNVLNCIIYERTGLLCPGCGTTRSCLGLIRHQYAYAFRSHPLFVIFSIIWAVISVCLFIGKPSFVRKRKFLLTLFIVMIVCWLIFGILRNIPGFEILQPLEFVNPYTQ